MLRKRVALIELRHLRYFVAVAERKNFSRAAEELRTAQPSLSQQIRQLEREIGVELFARGPRRIELTPAGNEFLSDARAILARVETAAAHAREAGRGLRGELRIAYTAPTMISTLPAAIRAYRNAFPNVRVTLRSMIPGALFDALAKRDVDAGVFLEQRDRGGMSGIVVRRLGSIDFGVVVPEGHRLARKRAIAIEEVGIETLLLYARSLTDVYDVVLQMCRERGFAPARIEEVDRVETILGLVAAGEGISIVPRVYETLGFRGVAYTALTPAPRPFSLVVARNGGARSSVAEAFVRTCETVPW